MNDTNLFLIILIGALQIGDVLTTEKILGKGGTELNPVMNWLFTKFGMHNVLVTKALLIITLAIIASVIAPIALILIAVIYVGVVAWNLNQIRKSK
jgi:hypothetical protein